jgi:hypothetical protein
MTPVLQRPDSNEVIAAIRAFRSIVEQGSREDYAALIAATTKLLETAARMKGETAGDTQIELPERRSSPEDHRVVQEGFPEIHTSQADDVAAEEWTVMPLDDLGDLYHDICVVDDLFLGGFEADARFEFRLGFELHWGEHALALIEYLLRSYRY